MSETYEALNTPVMRQFTEIKDSFPDSILFFRMGDFYEMFMEDAKEAALILDITLTKRQNQIPMAGIPYHAAEGYIARLIQAGKKVVVCEQTKSEDPKAKIMSREVVRIISPGTVIEDNLLGSYQNNYLSFLHLEKNHIFLAFADVSTADLLYFYIAKEETEKIKDTIQRFSPREVIYEENTLSFIPEEELKKKISLTPLRPEFLPDKKVGGLEVVVHVLDAYLKYNYRKQEFKFKAPKLIDETDFLGLDEKTIEHLELLENPNNKQHTLFSLLNHCRTATGKRFLRQRILYPSRNPEKLRHHWERILLLSQFKKERIKIAEALEEFIDIERVLTRFRGGKASPRDFRGIEKSIESYLSIKQLLDGVGYGFSSLSNQIEAYRLRLKERLYEGELPVFLGNSPFLKLGYSSEYDKAHEAKEKGKDWIIELEEREKQKSGLSSLKIRYNKILGYFIEISRVQAKEAPAHFLKKQTLVTGERFTTPELEDKERMILEADQIIEGIEKTEFEELVKNTLQLSNEFLGMAEEVASLDYHISLTICKEENGWVQPEIREDGRLLLNEGKHPVVEAFLPIGERFVPNSLDLDPKGEAIAVLTGPNMAGKSTFMRQVALIQILFQMGSFLPAKSASLSLVDRIFTRIGSGDNLTSGESTFFVEMKETAYILNQFTENSLILFDEVGRGTSTYDGLSIAWSILEFLCEKFPKPKVIFATHYHELTELSKENGIFNLFLDTYEKEDKILFLKKVKKGKSKQSFGIYVAKLAGLPESVTNRAKELLTGLESKKKEIRIKREEPSLFPNLNEISNLDEGSQSNMKEIITELKKIDINLIPPMEALRILEELSQRAKQK
ncbi:DNA mismatch repair protein MutS [Leptospira ryugenii]|uniref:DNA mismatch repair protein MutS n=1 Tax=Leptospira ryugenii TaxID=1917863 RepID=A0A2P2DZW0_9LEPT|nr:DNA mismatch repair protein MutS [Leptospira ryugenii]GBF50150.1 DNA mismatch repair protein MutS [Leptospira ryugenii]